MIEEEPEPEKLHADDEIKFFKELIIEMGEGDVRLLLYNTMGKLRVDEDYALALLKMALSCGIVSCYGLDGGWRRDGLGSEEVVMRLIYDKPVFFMSMMPPKDFVKRSLARGVREKILRAKISWAFRSMQEIGELVVRNSGGDK